MTMIWLHVEKQSVEKVANHAYYTFWYVLPTLPMFVLLPILLKRGWNFWLSLATSIVITVASFLLTAITARRLGLDLLSF